MLTRKEVFEQIKDKPWVSPFEKIICVTDSKNKLVQIYEYHARNTCYGAAAWAVFHYKQTSALIISAFRDGARDIFTLKPGKSKLRLKPSYSPAGIEEIKVNDDNVQIKYTGLAGGGVGSSFCRALAEGVTNVVIHSEGGGDKLGSSTIILPNMLKVHVGVDDTDRPGAGATWSLANEIGYNLNRQGWAEYLNHTLVQLYPGTPEKTTNCVATVLTFAVIPKKLNGFKKKIIKEFKRLTLSENTGLTFYQGIEIPKKLILTSNAARRRIITLSKVKMIAKELSIDLEPVSGERGLIGAFAALGYAEEQEKAVKIVI